MSDNIDYAELDKAVSEAIKARDNNAAPAKAAAPITVRKAAPAAKPVNHGRFMDFAPRKASQRPAAQPVQKPVARPVVKPSLQPTYTVTHTVTAVPHPAIAPRSAKRPLHTGATVSDMKPVAHHPQHNIAEQIQKKQQKVEQATAKVEPKATPKPVAKPVVKPVEVPTPKPAQKEEAPNANNYSLGVRSPFLTDAKVEKRPLGTNIPETSAAALRSTHNVYSEKSPTKKSLHHKKKQVVAETPKKHSGWLWALLVVLIIAAGAGLGYLAYTLVFAN